MVAELPLTRPTRQRPRTGHRPAAQRPAVQRPAVQRRSAAAGRRRRVFRHGLVAEGIFALVLAALLPTIVYPRLAVLPEDPQQLQVQRTDRATVLVPDPAAAAGASVVQAPVSISTFVSEARGQAREGSVVWDLATRVEVGGHGLLQARVERVSLDRRTGEPTGCCGDRLVTDTAEPAGKPLDHQGYLTFPFDVQKRSYPVWDVVLGTAREARFLGEEERAGMRVYRFAAANDWTPVDDRRDLPGALFGLPQASVRAQAEYTGVRTFWVEPATGMVVDLRERIGQRYRHGDRTVTAMSADLRSDPPSAQLLSDTRTGAAMLPWLRGRASLVLVLLAGVMFALAVRSSRRGATS